MKKVLIGIGIFVVVVIIGIVFFKAPDGDDWSTELKEMFGSRNSESQTANMESSVAPVAESSTTPDSSTTASDSATTGIKEFTVDGSNFKFVPNQIKVNKGDTVKITFNNTQGFHDFVIDGYNVRTKQIRAVATDSIQFVADKTGSFDFYCSVGNHRQMGMTGTLTVE